MVLHHLVVTNQPDNLVFKLMKNVTNLGEKFPSVQIGHGKGMGYKIILLRQHLDFLPEEDYVLFTDAHDVRVTGASQDILARYWDFGSEIVFAAERNCWPRKELESQYLDTSNQYRFLNSGGFIGTVKALKDFIDENFHNVSGITDDQLYYSQLYIKIQMDRKRIRLDNYATIFQCLHFSENDINEETLENEMTGTKPLVWHSNGYLTKFFMEKLCGLEYTPNVKLEIDQQLISPQKNVVALIVQTGSPILKQNSKYFFKVYEGLEAVGAETLRDAQKIIHEKYPDKWIAIFPSDFNLPEKFDYMIYGRVIDTRKMYMLATQMMTLAPFQMYYDKTKYDYDEFLRAARVDILAQI